MTLKKIGAFVGMAMFMGMFMFAPMLVGAEEDPSYIEEAEDALEVVIEDLAGTVINVIVMVLGLVVALIAIFFGLRLLFRYVGRSR